jgi:hypothetical protein
MIHMKAKTTVICAIYSKDPNRFNLLENHFNHLQNQTVKVHPIYVFENGDLPPSFLNGEIIVSNKLLTIYEAWNLALAACRTPLVMNLNLDDRLNTNAIEIMEQEIIDNKCDLVGGDWKVCYSQEETDAVSECYAAESTTYSSSWPPIEGTPTRLGSGTGERGTYGPATMWQLSAHIGFPRYPYRTTDGYHIRSVSDSIWWDILKSHLKRKLLRLPLIIGNYYSHPDSQAEFRVSNEWELLNNKSIELY